MLINCVVYEKGLKLADIDPSDISEWLVRPDAFVWVALLDPSAEELQRMQTEFDLHELAVEDALKGHQRPKIEEYGDMVFAVLHLVEPADSADQAVPAVMGSGTPAALTAAATGSQATAIAAPPRPASGPLAAVVDHGGTEGAAELSVGEVAIFVGPNFVLSSRTRSTHGFLGVRERCEREPQLLERGAGFVLYALMDAVVDRYFPVIELFEAELEGIEELIFLPGAARGNIERLYDLKHSTSVLRHAVAPLMEMLGKLYGGRVPPAFVSTQEYFRDVHDHLARINGSIDTIRDTIGTAIQVNLSMVAIEESETTKRLAAWAAIFAVSTALAGIWGMNFEGMPELKWRYGYPAALGTIVLAGLVLYRRFRKVGWL